MIEKMFEGPETFVIGNDSIQRCYIHSENKFVMAEETKVTKNFKCVLTVLNVVSAMEREFQLSFVSPKKLNINGHSNLRKISEKLLRASCKRKHAAPGAGNLNDR